MDIVIFDLDDTLYPEKQFVMSGFSAVAKHLHESYNIDENKILTMLNSDFNQGIRKKNFNVLVGKLKINDNIISELIKVYQEHKPDISLYSDAKRILEELKDKKKLGLITDGIPETQKNKLNTLNLVTYFDKIIINDILVTNKLNPICFKNMLKFFNTTPNHCIFIGDNPLKDFHAPKQLGIKTIQINRKTGEYVNVSVSKQFKADIIIESLTELTKVISLI